MWETIKDVTLFIIAFWGAIISTVLGVREIIKERRNITIFLLFYEFQVAYILSIVNTGRRPINIHSFNMAIKGIEAKDIYTQVRTGQLLDSNPDIKAPQLPMVLTDGQSVEFHLSPSLSDYIRYNGVKVSVTDSEGHVYTKYRTMEINEKYDKQ